MHDPMVVAYDLVLPFPRRKRFEDAREGDTFRNGWRRWRTTGPNPGRPVHKWWRPEAWRFRLRGKAYGLYRLGTVWHVEPGGRDAFTVCAPSRKNPDGSWRARSEAWKWHVHHWRIRLVPLQRLHRRFLERCGLCSRGFPAKYATFSHSWEGPKLRWWQIDRHAFHYECSSLIHSRQTVERDEEIIRGLVAYVRTLTDRSEADVVNELCGWKATWAEFPVRYRLEKLMGYEHDQSSDDGRLVKTTPRP